MNSNSIPDLFNHTFTDVYDNGGDSLVFVRDDGNDKLQTHILRAN